MPQLLLFVPCHKPVIDLEDNMLSIQDVLESISVDVPAGHEPPPGALAPFSWFTVALWYRLPADEGRQFEQRVRRDRRVNHSFPE